VVYYYLSGDVRILLDDEEWCVRVERQKSLLPGFRPRWVQVASFASLEEWEGSEYADTVNEDVQEQLVWFWVDQWNDIPMRRKDV
jgi:hypothetical protein